MLPPNNLGPDASGVSVNETQFKGMIGSLIYLTSSRPDIYFPHVSVLATDLQLADIFTKPLAEPRFTRLVVELEVEEETKTIAFLLLWSDEPLSFTQKEFISAIGLPICKDPVPLPPKETVRVGLETLGLFDKDKPSLLSTVLSLIPPPGEVNADDTADKFLSRTSVQPVTQPKAPTDLKTKWKRIPPSSKLKSPYKEFWYTAEVEEETKTIAFLLLWSDEPLSFTQKEFISAIGLPICKDPVPLPPKETVRVGLETLGLFDKDKPSLLSTVLVNSSPLKMKGIFIFQEKYVKDLLKKYDLADYASVKCLMLPPNNLGPDASGVSVNRTQFRGMIGSLIYLTSSRPDIYFPHVSVLGNIKLHFVPTDLQLADIFTKPLAEPRFTRLVVELEVEEETKTITFLLSWSDELLSFTQKEFISAIGLPICKGPVPLPPKEIVRVGLETLGLFDKDKPSLLSTVLPKAPTDLKTKWKRIPPSSKLKSPYKVRAILRKTQVTKTRHAEVTVATADATKSLEASELAEEQVIQPLAAKTKKHSTSSSWIHEMYCEPFSAVKEAQACRARIGALHNFYFVNWRAASSLSPQSNLTE
nr:uncharacterized mitochondrial protein AtMg00810-like [Tanacetum cinerariifolium]